MLGGPRMAVLAPEQNPKKMNGPKEKHFNVKMGGYVDTSPNIKMFETGNAYRTTKQQHAQRRV